MSSAATSGGPTAVLMSVPVPVPLQPLMPYQVTPGQPPNPALRAPFAPMPNGYAAIPGAVPQGTIPTPGGLFVSVYLVLIRLPKLSILPNFCL